MIDTLEVIATPPAAVAGVVNNITITLPPAPKAATSAQVPKKSQPALPKASALAAASSSGGQSFGIIGAAKVQEAHARDANGHAITTYADTTGASITLRGMHDGGLSVTLQDATRVTNTTSNTNGFVGSTLYPVTQLGTTQPHREMESAKGASGISFFAGRVINGDVYCGKESTSASNDVIDAVTRERIQSFAKAHPELAAKLRDSKEKITVLAGIPATMEQVQNTPATFQACPADKRQGVVVAK